MGDTDIFATLLDKVNLVRFGMNDIIKSVGDMHNADDNTKKFIVQGIAENAKVIQESIQHLKAAALDAPPTIELESAKMLASPFSLQYEQESIFSMPKRQKLSPAPQININAILEEVAQTTGLSLRKILDPFMQGDFVIGVSFLCRGVFKGELTFSNILNPFVIERISFCGLNEKQGQSKHVIFLAMTEQARAAITYYSAQYPGTEIQRIFQWIASFGNLFGAECVGCTKILHLDAAHSANRPIFLPPSFRTYESLLPFHPQCVTNCSA